MIRGRKGKGLISGLNSLNGLNALEEDSLTAEEPLLSLLITTYALEEL